MSNATADKSLPPPEGESAPAPPPPPPPPGCGSASVSLSEARYAAEGCSSDCRVDGRTRAEYRPYAVDVAAPSPSPAGGGPLVLSNGSSRVSLPGGDADVLCSVKAELVRPAPSKPDEGVVELNVDLLSSSSGGSGGGGAGGAGNRQRRSEEMELASALSRLVLPRCADRRALCVVPGKYAWRLAIDLTVLASDGALLDACGMAVRAAMMGTMLPIVTPVERADAAAPGKVRASDEFAVDGDYTSARPPPGAVGCPVAVTVYVIDAGTAGGGGRISKRKGYSALVVDARSEEEACSVSRISIGVDRDGSICGAYKYGSSSSAASSPRGSDGGAGVGGTVSLGALAEASEMAVRCSRGVFAILDAAAAAASGRGGAGLGAGGGSGDDVLRGHLDIR